MKKADAMNPLPNRGLWICVLTCAGALAACVVAPTESPAEEDSAARTATTCSCNIQNAASCGGTGPTLTNVYLYAKADRSSQWFSAASSGACSLLNNTTVPAGIVVFNYYGTNVNTAGNTCSLYYSNCITPKPANE